MHEPYDSESVAADIADRAEDIWGVVPSDVFYFAGGHAFLMDSPGGLHRFRVTVAELDTTD